jgi:hypothetical protein
MTPRQLSLVRALAQVSLPIGGRCDTTFVRHMGLLAADRPETVLSVRQSSYLVRLVHRFRRQLVVRVVEAALDEAESLKALHADAFSPRPPKLDRATRKRLTRSRQLDLFRPAAPKAGGGSPVAAGETASGDLA